MTDQTLLSTKKFPKYPTCETEHATQTDIKHAQPLPAAELSRTGSGFPSRSTSMPSRILLRRSAASAAADAEPKYSSRSLKDTQLVHQCIQQPTQSNNDK